MFYLISFCDISEKDLQTIKDTSVDYHVNSYGDVCALVSSLGNMDPFETDYDLSQDLRYHLNYYDYYALTPAQAEEYLNYFTNDSVYVKGIFKGVHYDSHVKKMTIERFKRNFIRKIYKH